MRGERDERKKAKPKRVKIRTNAMGNPHVVSMPAVVVKSYMLKKLHRPPIAPL